MDPVSSNVMSKSCDNPISSNCVTYTGPSLPGITICKGASVTEVLYQVAANSAASNNCCGGTFPAGNQSCYTGSWVDFSAGLPTAGSGSNYSWTIGNIGVGNTGNPSYKWTKEGDLSLRGGFDLNFSTTIIKNYVDIPLLAIPKTCFPSGWSNNQGILTSVDFIAGSQFSTISMRAVVYIDYPTGVLYLNFTFVDPFTVPMAISIDLGGVRFNLA